MSIQSALFPPEIWSQIARSTDPATRSSLLRTCKDARAGIEEDIVNIAAKAKIEELREYPDAEWGSKRLQYLLKATQRFSYDDQLTLIFNEVARCAEEGSCATVDDIPKALKYTAMTQARFLVSLFTSITWKCPEARQFAHENFSPWSYIDARNLNDVNVVSKWLEDHQEVLQKIKELEVGASFFPEIVLPHELTFLKNLRELSILIRNFNDITAGCLPHEVKKMDGLSIFFNEFLEMSSEAGKDYEYYLHDMKIAHKFKNRTYDRLGMRIQILLLDNVLNPSRCMLILRTLLAVFITFPYDYVKALITWIADKNNRPPRPALPF